MHFGEADESSDLRLIRQWIMIHSATHHLSPTVNQRLPRLSILTRVNVLVTTVHFYHAMLCIARTMLSQDVCPSVCLSHAGIVLKRLNVSSNFFHRRVATTFYSGFPCHTLMLRQHFNGDPCNGGAESNGV